MDISRTESRCHGEREGGPAGVRRADVAGFPSWHCGRSVAVPAGAVRAGPGWRAGGGDINERGSVEQGQSPVQKGGGGRGGRRGAGGPAHPAAHGGGGGGGRGGGAGGKCYRRRRLARSADDN